MRLVSPPQVLLNRLQDTGRVVYLPSQQVSALPQGSPGNWRDADFDCYNIRRYDRDNVRGGPSLQREESERYAYGALYRHTVLAPLPARLAQDFAHPVGLRGICTSLDETINVRGEHWIGGEAEFLIKPVLRTLEDGSERAGDMAQTEMWIPGNEIPDVVCRWLSYGDQTFQKMLAERPNEADSVFPAVLAYRDPPTCFLPPDTEGRRKAILKAYVFDKLVHD